MRLTYNYVKDVAQKNGIHVQRLDSRRIEVWREDHTVAECRTVAEAYEEVFSLIKNA